MAEQQEDYQELPNGDVITLRDVLKFLREVIDLFWSKKWTIILFVVIGGAMGSSYAHFTRRESYIGRLTFAVDEKGSSGGLSGIASQIGIDIGGGSGGIFTGDNLLLLLRSNKIISDALFSPVAELKNELLINYYIRTHLDLDTTKKERPAYYSLEKKQEEYTKKEKIQLSKIIEDIAIDAIKVARLDKKASIMELIVTSNDERFSIHMTRLLIEKATELYLEINVGKTKANLFQLESRVDSVRIELSRSMLQTAIESDQNQSSVLLRTRVPIARKQIETQMLTSLLGELVKNVELTKFSLSREEPVIHVIDVPTYPLQKKGRGRVIFAILGVFLSFVAISGYLLVKNFGPRIMNDKTADENVV